MPHIQVTQGKTPDTLRILVDGEDWSNRIYRDGFGLVRVGEAWGVSMVIAADSFDFDLPEGAILAEKESPCRKCAAERDGATRGGVA